MIIIDLQGKTIASTIPENAVNVLGQVDAVDSTALARNRVRRSYYWVEDDSDKVTIIESEHLRHALQNFRHEQHVKEKQREREDEQRQKKRGEEYAEDDEEIQEHTPLFVPNLFG
ncbi:uncharacterized protein LOC128866120 [Anastrepha ludens]|uniref:uncharacterized protein LOC128866120 n=1 Tax=Anastrepha ludens TaxID=28586 RepID=UPI0023B00B06|nr:uncharacterized protein LOC128866120 [Anastrepha ludens]